MAKRGPWQVVCDDVQDLLTSVNDPDKHILEGVSCMSVVRMCYVGHPDVMFVSVVCLSLREFG